MYVVRGGDRGGRSGSRASSKCTVGGVRAIGNRNVVAFNGGIFKREQGTHLPNNHPGLCRLFTLRHRLPGRGSTHLHPWGY